MQFALPPRVSPPPPRFARLPSRSMLLRRGRLYQVGVITIVAVSFLYFLSILFSSSDNISIHDHSPSTVVITVIDNTLTNSFTQNLYDNRIAYAEKHGYATFFANMSDYDNSRGSPMSWSMVPAVRHAMTIFPHSNYYWYLHFSAVIMNMDLSLESHIMDEPVLEQLMIHNQTIPRFYGDTKTSPDLETKDVGIVIAHDQEGLAHHSFIIRRGEWAKCFLDVWYDPIYRSYNFREAEKAALEHIFQWHKTILGKLALIPQKRLNSYAGEKLPTGDDGKYRVGDLVANFPTCRARDCQAEMAPYFELALRP